MTNYPNLNKEPELLKIETRDEEFKNLIYQTEKHDHENISNSIKIDKDHYKKKFKKVNKKKVLLFITVILVESGSAITTSTRVSIKPGAGIIISKSTVLIILTSIAILITNEYFSKLKIRYTNERLWINVITLL